MYQDAFAETSVSFTIETGDDGIGPYEYGSAREWDSQPYVTSSCNGVVHLTWYQEDLELTSEFTCTRDGGEGIDVEIVVTPIDYPVFEKMADGRIKATQSFSYEGEGSREGELEMDGDPDFEEPYVSEADYDRMEDAYFNWGDR